MASSDLTDCFVVVVSRMATLPPINDVPVYVNLIGRVVAKKHDFGYPKNDTSGVQNQNLKPDLKSVTKTHSKTGFEFKF